MPASIYDLPAENLRNQILQSEKPKSKSQPDTQLKLFSFAEVVKTPMRLTTNLAMLD